MAKRYNSSTETFEPIPDAPFYVLSNDTFMSGWGKAKDKINTCVVPCDTYEQAETVERYVRSRSEQKRVRIATNVRAKRNVIYSLCEGWKERAKENV